MSAAGAALYSAPVRYDLVLFDFDGTLADSFPWFITNLNDLAQRMRFRRVAPEDIGRLRGMPPREVLRHLGISWWKTFLLARRLRQRMAAEVGQIRLFPGCAAMLDALHRQGVTLGVLTSNAESNVRRVLGPSAAYIQRWACEVSMFGKRARLRALLRATRLPRDRVLLVGDELRDAEAARGSGVDFAAVTWGYTSRAALVAHGSTFLFDSLDQLVATLGGAGSQAPSQRSSRS